MNMTRLTPLRLAFAVIITTMIVIGSLYLIFGLAPAKKPVATQPSSSVLSDSTKPAAYKWNGDGLISLWFDDAWLSQYQFGFKSVENHGFKASLAVPTRAIGTVNYMTWQQVGEVYGKGWEINSHSRTHECDATKLTDDYARSELIGAKAELKQHGIETDSYVPPCGTMTPAVLAAAKSTYASLRTTNGGLNKLPVEDPYNLQVHTIERTTTLPEIQTWVDEAKANHGWLILSFHQIDITDARYGTTPDILDDALDIVKSSGLSVLLPTQILNMQK